MIISLNAHTPLVTLNNSVQTTKVSVIGQVAREFNQTPEQALVKQGKYEASSEYEPLLGAELEKLGITFIPNYAIEQYNADLGLPDVKLAIEVDGGDWHSRSLETILADAKKEQILVEQGWTILRFAFTQTNKFLAPLYAREIKMLYDRLLASK